MSMGSYFDNDLALYKSFHIVREQNLQFRISAFDWMNHALPQFSSANQIALHYNVDYASKAITLNQCTMLKGCQETPLNFGYMDVKTGGNYSRILELNVKYNF
jgi:hypothetical protein